MKSHVYLDASLQLMREKRTSLMLIFRGSLPFTTSHSTTYMSYYIVCRGRLVIVERLPHRTKKTAHQTERDAFYEGTPSTYEC